MPFDNKFKIQDWRPHSGCYRVRSTQKGAQRSLVRPERLVPIFGTTVMSIEPNTVETLKDVKELMIEKQNLLNEVSSLVAQLKNEEDNAKRIAKETRTWKKTANDMIQKQHENQLLLVENNRELDRERNAIVFERNNWKTRYETLSSKGDWKTQSQTRELKIAKIDLEASRNLSITNYNKTFTRNVYLNNMAEKKQTQLTIANKQLELADEEIDSYEATIIKKDNEIQALEYHNDIDEMRTKYDLPNATTTEYDNDADVLELFTTEDEIMDKINTDRNHSAYKTERRVTRRIVRINTITHDLVKMRNPEGSTDGNASL